MVRAELLAIEGQLEKSLEEWKTIQEEAEEGSVERLNSLSTQAALLLDLTKFVDAEKLIQSTLLPAVTTNSEAKALALGLLGTSYQRQNHQIEAKHCFEKVLKVCSEGGTAWLQLAAKYAKLLEIIGELDQALEWSERLMKQDILHGNPHLHAELLGNIAAILFKKGNFEEALSFYLKTARFFEMLGQPELYLLSIGGAALSLQFLGRGGEAMKLYSNWMPFFEKYGSLSSLSAIKSNLANLLIEQGHLESALALLKNEVAPIDKRLGDKRNMAATQSLIATILHSQGKLEEAIDLTQDEILPAFQSLNLPHEYSQTQLNLAQLLLQKGTRKSHKEARTLLTEAYTTLQAHNFPEATQAQALLQQYGWF
jgi:tetratricopeptide (TPR) repeat protein